MSHLNWHPVGFFLFFQWTSMDGNKMLKANRASLPLTYISDIDAAKRRLRILGSAPVLGALFLQNESWEDKRTNEGRKLVVQGYCFVYIMKIHSHGCAQRWRKKENKRSTGGWVGINGAQKSFGHSGLMGYELKLAICHLLITLTSLKENAPRCACKHTNRITL